MTKAEGQKKVVSLARSELGYREGSNNWTKYAADALISRLYGWVPQNQPWCATFINWLFLTAFGWEIGSKILYGGSAACSVAAQNFKSAGAFFRTPEIGDQAFYYSGSGINHTGLVVEITGNSFTAIEGNYSDKVSLVRHQITSSDIAGFGRPKWSLVGDVPDPDTGSKPQGQENPEPKWKMCAAQLPVLKRGGSGAPVERMQTLLIGRGYYCGGPKISGREYPDGDFGPATEVAVKDVQLAAGITRDGVVGQDTWQALIIT